MRPLQPPYRLARGLTAAEVQHDLDAVFLDLFLRRCGGGRGRRGAFFRVSSRGRADERIGARQGRKVPRAAGGEAAVGVELGRREADLEGVWLPRRGGSRGGWRPLFTVGTRMVVGVGIEECGEDGLRVRGRDVERQQVAVLVGGRRRHAGRFHRRRS